MGTVYIVATPIGNLEDITHRAVRILQQVSCILAEDTRHSRQLLSHLGIKTRLESLHEHNEAKVVDYWLEQVRQGADIALISDAGTPLVSDPGYLLVHRARQADIPVSPVPGASAVIAALSVSGLATDRFCFEGFLPARQQARRDRLHDLQSELRTLVFYEAPHRIRDTLNAMAEVFGSERPAAVARELTKLHEEVVSGTLASLASAEIKEKGEIVIVVAGTEKKGMNLESEQLLRLLLQEMGPSKAAALAAELTGEARKALYQQALKLKEA